MYALECLKIIKINFYLNYSLVYELKYMGNYHVYRMDVGTSASLFTPYCQNVGV